MIRNLPQAILFDLDETIVTAGSRHPTLLAVAREFAAELAPLQPAAVADRVEAALAEFWSDPAQYTAARFDPIAARRKVIGDLFAAMNLPQLTPDLTQRFEQRFSAYRDHYTLLAGARETLAALKGRGLRLALVTNGRSDIQRAKIERFSLAPLFDHIQIEGECGFGKPDPRAYRHAMAALAAQPHQTWMVGDNLEWEVAAPQRLGIFAIWHDVAGRGLPPGSTVRPDLIIRSLAELIEG